MRFIISIIFSLIFFFTFPINTSSHNTNIHRLNRLLQEQREEIITDVVGPRQRQIVDDATARRISNQIIEEGTFNQVIGEDRINQVIVEDTFNQVIGEDAFNQLMYMNNFCSIKWNYMVEGFNLALNSERYHIIQYITPMGITRSRAEINLRPNKNMNFIVAKTRNWITEFYNKYDSFWYSYPVIAYSKKGCNQYSPMWSTPKIICYGDPIPSVNCHAQSYGLNCHAESESYGFIGDLGTVGSKIPYDFDIYVEMRYYYDDSSHKSHNMIFVMHGKLCLDWYSIFPMDFRFNPVNVRFTITLVKSLDEVQWNTYVIKRYMIMPGSCMDVAIFGFAIYDGDYPYIILNASNEDILPGSKFGRINPILTVDNWTLVLF